MEPVDKFRVRVTVEESLPKNPTNMTIDDCWDHFGSIKLF